MGNPKATDREPTIDEEDHRLAGSRFLNRFGFAFHSPPRQLEERFLVADVQDPQVPQTDLSERRRDCEFD